MGHAASRGKSSKRQRLWHTLFNRERLDPNVTSQRPRDRIFYPSEFKDKRLRYTAFLLIDSLWAKINKSSDSLPVCQDPDSTSHSTQDEANNFEAEAKVNKPDALSDTGLDASGIGLIKREEMNNSDVKEDDIHSDLWSKAYQEALNNMAGDLDTAILAGKNAEHMFKELERLDKKTSEQSAVMRGLRYLHSLQVPLQHLKFVLDIANPISAINPAASTAIGVVKSVTTASNLLTLTGVSI